VSLTIILRYYYLQCCWLTKLNVRLIKSWNASEHKFVDGEQDGGGRQDGQQLEAIRTRRTVATVNRTRAVHYNHLKRPGSLVTSTCRRYHVRLNYNIYFVSGCHGDWGSIQFTTISKQN
jgi:hypothetical protein